MAKKIVLKNHNTMTIMVTFFGQHYFHNVNLRFASIHIMKIMLTKKSDIIVHNIKMSMYETKIRDTLESFNQVFVFQTIYIILRINKSFLMIDDLSVSCMTFKLKLSFVLEVQFFFPFFRTFTNDHWFSP